MTGIPRTPASTPTPTSTVGVTVSQQQQQTETIYHRVKKGENLTFIAQKYGVTVKDIIDANPILKLNPNGLARGMVLKVPNAVPPAFDGSPSPIIARTDGTDRIDNSGRSSFIAKQAPQEPKANVPSNLYQTLTET